MEHVLATINRTMCASGLNETMTYSFAEPTELDRLRMPKDGLGDAVELINPMNADQSVMRQSIIPGLLRSVAHNQARGVKNIQLYEQGMVFYAHEGRKQPKERRKLAGVMAGAFADAGWNQQPAAFDFFDGKGAVENLMRELARCILWLALPTMRRRPLWRSSLTWTRWRRLHARRATTLTCPRSPQCPLTRHLWWTSPLRTSAWSSA